VWCVLTAVLWVREEQVVRWTRGAELLGLLLAAGAARQAFLMWGCKWRSMCCPVVLAWKSARGWQGFAVCAAVLCRRAIALWRGCLPAG
jgi:hypothetical protein